MNPDSAGPSTPGIFNSALRMAGFNRKRGRDVEADPIVEEFSSKRGELGEEVSRVTKIRVKSQQETEHLRDTIKDRDKLIQALENQVCQLQEAHGEAVKQRDEYFCDISKMTIQHRENVQDLLSHGAAAFLQSQLLEAQKQHQDLVVQLKRADDLIESQCDATKRIEELETRLKEAGETESQKDATKRIQELETRLKEADETVERCENAALKTEQQLSDDRATIQALKSNVADLEGVQEQLSQMQKTDLESKNRINTLESALEDCKDVMRKPNARTAEIEEVFSQDLSEIRRENEKLQEDLRTQREEIGREAERKVAALELSNQEYAKKLKDEKKRTALAQTQLKNRTSELKVMEDQNVKQESELEQLRTQREEIDREANHQRSSVSMDNEQLRQKVAALESSNQEHAKKLNDEKQRTKLAETQLKNRTGELKAMEDQNVEQLRTQREEIGREAERKVAALELSNQEHAKKLEDEKQRTKLAQTHLKDRTDKLKAMEDQNVKQQTELQQRSSQIEHLRTEQAEHSHELQQWRDRVRLLEENNRPGDTAGNSRRNPKPNFFDLRSRSATSRASSSSTPMDVDPFIPPPPPPPRSGDTEDSGSSSSASSDGENSPEPQPPVRDSPTGDVVMQPPPPSFGAFDPGRKTPPRCMGSAQAPTSSRSGRETPPRTPVGMSSSLPPPPPPGTFRLGAVSTLPAHNNGRTSQPPSRPVDNNGQTAQPPARPADNNGQTAQPPARPADNNGQATQPPSPPSRSTGGISDNNGTQPSNDTSANSGGEPENETNCLLASAISAMAANLQGLTNQQQTLFEGVTQRIARLESPSPAKKRTVQVYRPKAKARPRTVERNDMMTVIRAHMQELLEIRSDKDIVNLKDIYIAESDVAEAYENDPNAAVSPSLTPLQIFWETPNTKWNLVVAGLFVDDLIEKGKCTPLEEDQRDMAISHFLQRIETLKKELTKTVPKNGEDPTTFGESLVRRNLSDLQRKRKRSRQKNLYQNRLDAARTAGKSDPIMARVAVSIEAGGVEATSSDESDPENPGVKVVNRPDWRADSYLNTVTAADDCRPTTNVYGGPKPGGQPVKRIRYSAPHGPISKERPPVGRPANYYKEVFLNSMNQRERDWLEPAPSQHYPWEADNVDPRLFETTVPEKYFVSARSS